MNYTRYIFLFFMAFYMMSYSLLAKPLIKHEDLEFEIDENLLKEAQKPLSHLGKIKTAITSRMATLKASCSLVPTLWQSLWDAAKKTRYPNAQSGSLSLTQKTIVVKETIKEFVRLVNKELNITKSVSNHVTKHSKEYLLGFASLLAFMLLKNTINKMVIHVVEAAFVATVIALIVWYKPNYF